MRWTAEQFWRERGDVEVGGDFFGSINDLLRAAFRAGASEAEVLGAHPEPGYATLRVVGLPCFARRGLAWRLNRKAPVGTTYVVERMQ